MSKISKVKGFSVCLFYLGGEGAGWLGEGSKESNLKKMAACQSKVQLARVACSQTPRGLEL